MNEAKAEARLPQSAISNSFGLFSINGVISAYDNELRILSARAKRSRIVAATTMAVSNMNSDVHRHYGRVSIERLMKVLAEKKIRAELQSGNLGDSSIVKIVIDNRNIG